MCDNLSPVPGSTDTPTLGPLFLTASQPLGHGEGHDLSTSQIPGSKHITNRISIRNHKCVTRALQRAGHKVASTVDTCTDSTSGQAGYLTMVM